MLSQMATKRVHMYNAGTAADMRLCPMPSCALKFQAQVSHSVILMTCLWHVVQSRCSWRSQDHPGPRTSLMPFAQACSLVLVSAMPLCPGHACVPAVSSAPKALHQSMTFFLGRLLCARDMGHEIFFHHR